MEEGREEKRRERRGSDQKTIYVDWTITTKFLEIQNTT